MRRSLWFVVVLVVLLLAGGGAVVALRLTESQKRVRRELRAAAGRHVGTDGKRVPAEVLDALGYVESRWRLGARSTHEADEALGGSYGPTQLSRATATANGYDGSMETLGADAWLSAEWTARSLVAGARNAQGRVLKSTPQTVADASAWWNAGRQSAAELSPSHVTRRVYIPRALAALDLVRSTPA